MENPTVPQKPTRKRWAMIGLVCLVVALGWYLLRALREAQSAVPSVVPQAAEMTALEFNDAEKTYIASLKTGGEREAFEKGKVLFATKSKTWGQDTRNMGESVYAESQGFSRREAEAFAMGLHFAHGQAQHAVAQ